MLTELYNDVTAPMHYIGYSICISTRGQPSRRCSPIIRYILNCWL